MVTWGCGPPRVLISLRMLDGTVLLALFPGSPLCDLHCHTGGESLGMRLLFCKRDFNAPKLKHAMFEVTFSHTTEQQQAYISASSCWVLKGPTVCCPSLPAPPCTLQQHLQTLLQVPGSAAGSAVSVLALAPYALVPITTVTCSKCIMLYSSTASQKYVHSVIVPVLCSEY